MLRTAGRTYRYDTPPSGIDPATPCHPGSPPGGKGVLPPTLTPPTASDCYSDWIFPFVWPINSIYRYFYYNGTAIKPRSGSRPRVFIVGMKRSNTTECFLHGMFGCLFVCLYGLGIFVTCVSLFVEYCLVCRES